MVAKSCTMKHGKSWDYNGIFAHLQTGAGFLYLNFQNHSYFWDKTKLVNKKKAPRIVELVNFCDPIGEHMISSP